VDDEDGRVRSKEEVDIGPVRAKRSFGSHDDGMDHRWLRGLGLVFLLIMSKRRGNLVL